MAERRSAIVSHRDVKAIIKAVEAAGKVVTGVKVAPDGTIEVMTQEAAVASADDDADARYERLKALHAR